MFVLHACTYTLTQCTSTGQNFKKPTDLKFNFGKDLQILVSF